MVYTVTSRTPSVGKGSCVILYVRKEATMIEAICLLWILSELGDLIIHIKRKR